MPAQISYRVIGISNKERRWGEGDIMGRWTGGERGGGETEEQRKEEEYMKMYFKLQSNVHESNTK